MKNFGQVFVFSALRLLRSYRNIEAKSRQMGSLLSTKNGDG